MDLPRSSERLHADAYTRASLDAYLRAAAEERARVEREIEMAHGRRDEALRNKRLLDARAGEAAPDEPRRLTRATVDD